MIGKEKRRVPRIDLYLPLTVKRRKGARKIRDLSLTGLFIELNDTSSFQVRDEVDLVIDIPYESSAMEVRARVVRVTGDGMGVDFMNMPAQTAHILEYWFNVYRHTVPIPGSREK